MRASIALASLLLCTGGLAACDGGSPTTTKDAQSQGGLADRDPALAKRLVDEGALLLDVRTGLEFGTGSIAGAKNIPYDEVPDRVDEILALQGGDKHKPIVLFCRSGGRAGTAKDSLVAAGFDQVTNLGGVSDWPGN
jgi:phage shock protein E